MAKRPGKNSSTATCVDVNLALSFQAVISTPYTSPSTVHMDMHLYISKLREGSDHFSGPGPSIEGLHSFREVCSMLTVQEKAPRCLRRRPDVPAGIFGPGYTSLSCTD